MHKRIINAFQLMNILFQAIYSLAFPIGTGALVSFLLTKYASVPTWIWAILLTLGAITGLFSMIKYILTAMAGMDRLEKQREKLLAEKVEKENRQAALREAGKTKGNNTDE